MTVAVPYHVFCVGYFFFLSPLVLCFVFIIEIFVLIIYVFLFYFFAN